MKNGPPLILRLQIDEILGVAESSRVGAVVGRSGLRDDVGDLGEGGENVAGLRGEALPLRQTCTVRHRATGPNCAFIEMRQELRADHTAESEEHRHHEAGHPDSYGYPAVIDGLPDRAAIPFRQCSHNGVTPFLDAFAEQPAAKHRCDEDRVGHGAE